MKEKETFIIEDFDIKLETEYLGRNFLYTDSIDSTNKFLLKSKEDFPEGTVLLSEEQTHGRGRKQRVWFSLPELSLTFSVLLKQKVSALNLSFLSLASAAAVAQAIENLYQLKVNLKWPNDVLVNNKKVAGILLESKFHGLALEKVVIGIGINVNQPFFKGSYNLTPTSIRLEFGKAVNREKLLSELLNIFEGIIEELQNNRIKVLNYWREKCRFIGEKVTITDDKFQKFGIFEDIDEDGAMLLRTPKGIEKITFGDIS